MVYTDSDGDDTYAPGDSTSDSDDGSSSTDPTDPGTVDPPDEGNDTSLTWEALKGIIPGSAFLVFVSNLGTDTFETAKNLLKDPDGTIGSIINDWVFTNVVHPIAGTLLRIGELAVSGVLYAFFGADREPFNMTGLGLADPPLYFAQQLIFALEPAGRALLTPIEQFNETIRIAASDLGLAGPAVVMVLWTFEAVVVFYGVYMVLQLIDVPVLKLGVALDYARAPFRWILGDNK